MLTALVEVGRKVLEEQAERSLYDELYRVGVPDDDTAGAFAFYDTEANEAFVASAATPSGSAEPTRL